MTSSVKKEASDKLMRQMTKKSLKGKPHSQITNQPKKANKPQQERAKPIISIIDTLKKTGSKHLVYLSAESLNQLVARPDGLTFLRQYQERKALKPAWTFQVSAVQFAKLREADVAGLGTRGYMLCDEMGLGKTRSMLTIILEQNQLESGKSGKRFNGPTLVVCKEQHIDHWLSELEDFPEQTFYTEILTSERDTLKDWPHKKKKQHIEECCDIVFTTYSTITNAYIKSHDARHRILFEVRWKRVSADEGHVMVKDETQIFAAMSALNSGINVVISGTPKQNHDDDIRNLARYIGLHPREGEQEIALEKFMLRRSEEDIRATEMVDPTAFLPSKRQPVLRKIEYIDFMTNAEKLLYCTYAKLALERGNGISITCLISVMRQLCVCPAMIKNLVLPDSLLAFGQKSSDPKKPQTMKLGKIVNSFFPSDSETCTVFYKNGHSYQTSTLPEEPCEFQWNCRKVFTPLEERVARELRESKDWSKPIPLVRDSTHEEKEVIKSVLDRVIRFDIPMSKERAILNYISTTPLADKIIIFDDMIEPLYRMSQFLKNRLGFESIVATGENEYKDSGRIEKFRSDPSFKVLLMSLKYGNEGFNIPEANIILFMGPWWNPSPMKQGEFRIQRPGQKKQVHIVYFIMKNTLENYVMNLAEKKNLMKSSLSVESLKRNTSPIFDYQVSFSSVMMNKLQ